MSFSPLFVKIFCRSSGSLANRHVDNFVHKLFTSLLIYYHAFYSMMFVFVFHAVKIFSNVDRYELFFSLRIIRYLGRFLLKSAPCASLAHCLWLTF